MKTLLLLFQVCRQCITVNVVLTFVPDSVSWSECADFLMKDAVLSLAETPLHVGFIPNAIMQVNLST